MSTDKEVDFSSLVPVRATINAGGHTIQTRYVVNIFETHIFLAFPDAKGLRLVFNLGELEKLKELIEERIAINKHGGG